MDKALKGLAISSTIGMLIVIIMGALVTNTGSADGCGSSWPLCYGQVIPDQADTKTWIELSHRIVSGLLGFMVTGLAVWAWIRFPRVKEVKVLGILAVLFIVVQALLGGAAVIWQQSSFALALHFGFSLIAFVGVLLLTVVIFEQLDYKKAYIPKVTKSFKIHIYSLTVYTYIVVYLGAFVRYSGSAMGCGTSWPLCNGEWIPALGTPAGVQFIHRVAAAAVFFWVLWLLIKVSREAKEDRGARWSTLIAFLLVAAQVASGAFVVLSGLDLAFLLLHSFLITCFFGVLCYLFMIVSRMKNP